MRPGDRAPSARFCAKGGKPRTSPSLQNRSHHRQRRNRRRLRAQDARPQRHSPPAIGIKERLLLPEPIRLRARSQSPAPASLSQLRRPLLPSSRSVVDRSCSASTSARSPRRRPHTRGQRNRIVDHRHIGAPRLLSRLVRDAPPALDALLRGLARCFSVRRAITGAIAATPNSVAFSIAHSM